MKATDKFLRSKVAHRVVLLFISCALLPVTMLAVVSYFEVSQQLRELSQKELSQATRRQGMEVYERLELLDSDLQVLAANVREHRGLTDSPILQKHYRNLGLFSSSGERREGWGSNVSLPDLDSAQRKHLLAGNPLLKVVHSQDSTEQVLLVRIADAQSGEMFLVGEPQSEFLFSPLSLSPELKLCVLSASRSALFCSDDELSTQIAAATPASRASGEYQWRDGDTSYDAAYWKLLTRPSFLQDSWTIVVSKDHAAALAPMTHFSRIFPLVVLLSLWIVLLSSLIQIRRTLGPLEQLQEGTRKIGMRKFEHRVQVHSGDEFEGLAHSLNLMSAQLGRQFHALRTVNEIDQAIFASLDREAIIDGVLQRLPRLFPADVFGVGVLEETRVSGSLRFRLNTGEFRTAPLKLATTDWLQLQRGGRSIAVSDEHGLPVYLEPLRQAGMRSGLLLPIRVDNAIQAVLVCASESAHITAVEDQQEVEQVADQLAVALSHVHLIHALEDLHLGTLKALARAIDAKSQWTAGHSERVTNLAVQLGCDMGLSQKDLRIMEMGGLLHDIGKIGTPPSILDKPDKLSPEEMRIMRDHVRCGVRILEPIRSFRDALPIVAQHHEWFNGMGYPEGLAGQDIHLYARIFAVADCYDALKSDRPYRGGMSKEKTMAILTAKSGTQFDPAVIDLLAKRMQDEETRTSAAHGGEGR